MKLYEKNIKLVGFVLAGMVFLFCACTLLGINAGAFHESAAMEDAGASASQESDKELKYFTDFELPLLDGTTYTSDNVKEHKVTVFNAWAPWCSGCVAEMPELEELSKEYEARGLYVVGVVGDYDKRSVSNQGYKDEVSTTVKDTGVEYPIGLADQRFDTEVVPMMADSYPGTWAVDSEGHLIEFFSGTRSAGEWKECFDKWLDAVNTK